MKKTTLSLIVTVGFLFLCIPHLFAVEKDKSSWTDFFSLFPSEEPAKIDAATESNLDSSTEMPVVKEESLVKPQPHAPKLLYEDMRDEDM